MDQQLITFLVGLIGIVVGAILGGGSVLIVTARILTKVKTDLPALDYLEKLYNSISAEVVKEIIRDLAAIGGKITDGLPNEAPNPQG